MTKQKLWGLIEAYRASGGREEHHARKDRLDAVLDALLEQPAQPQQRPVAWLDPWTRNNVTADYDAYGKHGIPLYTSPPASKPWVGLTSEDKVEILRANGEAAVLILTEAKLREKNA